MRNIKRWCTFVCVLLLISSATPFARAQSTDDLRKQLEDLKKQYEQTTAEFQKRIADLEEKLNRQSTAAGSSTVTPPAAAAATPTPPAVEEAAKIPNASASAPSPVTPPPQSPSTAQVAAQAAKDILLGQSKEVGPQYQGQLSSEPTYDLLNEAEVKIANLQQQVSSFEFHGYFRSGAGANGLGGQMVAFQAPAAGAKFRLGNEAETYGELIFVNNWLNADQIPGSAWFKTEVMVEANTTNSDTYANFPGGTGNDQFRLREAFVRAGNLFSSQPDAKFWAGERYYRRQHIDIDDFFPLDTSGYGAGFEDFNVGIGRVAVAYLFGSRPDVVTENGNYTKRNLDVRLYDLKAPVGWLGAWFDYATEKGGTTTAGTFIPNNTGFAGGVRYQNLEWHGGYNAVGFQYGTGAAASFNSSADVPTSYTPNATTLLVTDHMLIQPNDRFAIMPIFLYRRTSDGNSAHGHNDWVSFGARPVIFFNNYVSLALEGGADYTDGYNATANAPVAGWLSKFTVAPQIGAGRKFFSRPVLRTFFTWSGWSEPFRGLVGSPAYNKRTSGISYGVQAETWW